MKFFLTTTLLFFFTSTFAQFSISGYLSDEQKEPLSFASVVLVKKSDSTLVAFGLTNENGKYVIDVDEKGEYLLQYSFLGFQTKYNELENDWKERNIVLKTVVLKTADIQLGEVSVEAERIPMKMKGDTIQYDAKAFKVAEGSDVEKLLEKMPGIEIDEDGNVTAYGKKVEKIMVDGKEFFGDDPKMATKNLEAKAIDKVEVLDKKSDDAEFSGVDDGEEQKTINLTLKEEYKKGSFGKAMIGVGTDDTYKGKINYNRFNDKSQFSLILNANNINEQPFTWQEYNEFSGGNGWNRDVIRGIGGNEGINDAISSGVNFNHEFNKKLKIKTFYFLTRNDKTLDKETFTSNFFGDTTFNTDATINKGEILTNHAINVELEWKPDSLTIVEYTANGTLKDESYDSDVFTLYTPTANTLNNFTDNLNDITVYKSSVNQSLSYKRKFKKKKRNFNITGEYFFGDQTNETNINNTVFGTDIIQYQDYDESMQNSRVSGTYTEPLDSFWTVSGSLNFRNEENNPQKDFFDINGNNERIFNTALSSAFTRETNESKGSVTFRRNKNKLNFSFGATATNINLNAASIDRNYQYILPYARLRYRLKGSQNINIGYFSNYSLPSLNQLITIPDNSNSNQLYVGNAALRPEFSHRVNFNYYYFNPATKFNIYVGGNLNFVEDRISSRVDINSDFTRFTTPENTGNASFTNFWSGFSNPVKPLKIKVGFHGWGNTNNYDAFINNKQTRVTSTDYNLRIDFRRLKKEKWDLVVGANIGRNNREYENNSEFNQDLTNYGWFARFEYDITKSLTFEARYNLDRFAETSFAEAREFHRVNANIRKSFNNDRWAISLTANDILNVNEGVQRSGDATSLFYSQYNTRAQYFMILFERSLGKKKDDGKKKNFWFD